MSIQITDVCRAGACTVSYPDGNHADAETHWKLITENPNTNYAQWVDRHGRIERRYTPEWNADW